MCVAGSKGQVGENGEEIEPHLLVYGIGVEEEGGRRRFCSPTAVFRRGREEASGLGRFRGTRGTRSGARLEPREGGWGCSTELGQDRQPW